MKKLISITLLILSAITLVSCTNQNKTSINGDYYWISSERNELAFTIKDGKGTIKRGDADGFTVNETTQTLELSGNNVSDSTTKYKLTDGTISANLTGTERTYYKKDSYAYQKALKEYGYK